MPMDGGEIDIQVVAKTDGLDQGLGEAKDKVSGFGSTMDGVFEDIKGAGEGLETFLTGFAGGVLGGVLIEAAEKAVEIFKELGEAFLELAPKAAEFGESTQKLAAEIGISEERAAGLEQALKQAGVSTEEYSGTLSRMETRLRTQEQAWNAYGIATRDATGNLLNGEQIMNNAIATMQTYKVGTDQAAFAHEVFGRSVDSVYNIMRLHAEMVQENIDKLQDFGYEEQGAGQRSEQFNEAVNGLKVTMEDWALTIGQRLMPAFADWANAMAGPLSEGLKLLGDLILVVAQTVEVLVSAFRDLIAVATGAISGVTDMVGGLGGAINNLAHGDLAAAGGSLKGIFTSAAADGNTMYRSLLGNNSQLMTELDALNGKFAAVKEGVGGVGAGGDKAFENLKTGAAGTKPAMDQAVKEFKQMQGDIIATDQQTANTQVKIQQQANDAQLRLKKESVAQWADQSRKLADEEYSIKKAAIEKQDALNSGDAVKHQKYLDDIKKLDADHALQTSQIQNKAAEDQMRIDDAAAKHHGAATKSAANAAATAAKEETQSYILQMDAKLAAGIHAIEQEYQQHKISADQKDQLEKQLTEQIKSEELKRLDAELATLKEGTAIWNSVYQERLRIAQEMYKKLDQTVASSAKTEQGSWSEMAKQDYQAFTQSLNGMLLGTTSWKQALGSILDSVATNFLNMVEKNVENWLFGEATKSAVTQATQATSAVQQVTSAAGVAGANTFASTSAIPVIGPGLAPGAAAAAVAETMSFSSLAVAERGMVLDRDRLVFAHKDEQILPADIAKGMTGLIKNGGTSNKSEVNLHYNPVVNAPQQKSLMQMLSDEGHTMRAWFKAQQRDGYLKGA